jgi:hypothetical protein
MMKIFLVFHNRWGNYKAPITLCTFMDIFSPLTLYAPKLKIFDLVLWKIK